ncbi:MAG TPA: YtxH domain-containing protein [Flavisolibacter sp.]|jgi:gas vesicle protein|nr:YtxH domain-containing protein [Flavisolibacter sp.]
MTTRTKVILGVVGAAAAGAALALLLAPEKGAELRARISQRTGDWSDQLADIFANAKGEIENLTGRAKQAASDTANRYS